MRIGIDLGGTNIAVGLVNDNMEIVRRDKRKTLADRGTAAIVKDMAELCLSLCESEGMKLSDVKSVGIGSPGSIDTKNGIVVFAANLGFRYTKLAGLLSEQIGVPVLLGNDANVAALGEFYAGAGKNYESMIMVTLGTGVGGGIIFNGKIFEGFNGMAGEVGHMATHSGGWKCTCGRTGCWEAYASATGLIRMTKESMDEHPESSMHTVTGGTVNGRTAFLSGRAGDAAGLEVIDRYLNAVACGAANLINLFQPEALCIGGGISGEGDYIIERLNPMILAESFDVGENRCQLCLATLGNDAGIIGAALLGL